MIFEIFSRSGPKLSLNGEFTFNEGWLFFIFFVKLVYVRGACMTKNIVLYFFILWVLGCSTVSISNNFEKSIGTQYSLSANTVGGFDLSQQSNGAPLRSLVIAKINVGQKKAFDLMLKGIHKWFPGVKEFTWAHTLDGKIVKGSVRTGYYDGDKMVEPVLFIKPGQFYIYKIDLESSEAFIPISNHIGAFTVEEISKDVSLVIWRQY